jgi:hypothetical protein
MHRNNHLDRHVRNRIAVHLPQQLILAIEAANVWVAVTVSITSFGKQF